LFAVAEVVRTAFGSDVRLRTRRSLDERLMVRWPGAWQTFAHTLLLLPPRSRLRRALLRRAVVSGWSAWSRGDLDLMLVRFARDYQYETLSEFVAAGLRSSYAGHAGAREFTVDLSEAFDQMDLTPLEILDAGNRFVVLGRFRVRGRGSGVETDSPLGQTFWVERGLVVRDCMFLDWDAALRAAGIPTDARGDLDLAADAGTAAAPD
jgi:ketosteroid isomerase-like protein